MLRDIGFPARFLCKYCYPYTKLYDARPFLFHSSRHFFLPTAMLRPRQNAKSTEYHSDIQCFCCDVGVTGLEPATTRPPDAYANQLRHTPNLEGGIAHQKHLLPNCECKGSAEIAILQAKPQKPIAFLTENSNFAISFCYLHHNMTQNILPRRCCNDLDNPSRKQQKQQSNQHPWKGTKGQVTVPAGSK